MLRRAAQGVLGVALSLIAATAGPATPALADGALGGAPPLYDAAKVVASEQRAALSSSLEQLERCAGGARARAVQLAARALAARRGLRARRPPVGRRVSACGSRACT